MDDCIFCKIVAGEIPCHKVYEDENTLAFLDINPPVEGFTLVIPKKHVPYIWDLEDEDYSLLADSVKKVGKNIRDSMSPTRVGIQVEGLEVDHTHVKVFPFDTSDEFRSLGDGSPTDNEKLSKTAEKLYFE